MDIDKIKEKIQGIADKKQDILNEIVRLTSKKQLKKLEITELMIKINTESLFTLTDKIELLSLTLLLKGNI